VEQETFWTLLHDGAHWEFELVVSLVFLGIEVALSSLFWPFVRKHWKHHLDRDKHDNVK
jgi:hypothetical protein